jgi:hypothetical protein
VGKAGIAVGLAETASIVFVGKGADRVEGATDTDMSHAIATRMNMEMNKRGVLLRFMAEFPFAFDHIHRE